MDESKDYKDAVKAIKEAILKSQYEAAKGVNEKQLMLYFAIGKYISLNSRNGFWGKGAIDSISDQLQRELPGLRGFSARKLKYMRTFYEEWEMLDPDEEKGNSAIAIAKLEKDGPSNSANAFAELEEAGSNNASLSNSARTRAELGKPETTSPSNLANALAKLEKDGSNNAGIVNFAHARAKLMEAGMGDTDSGNLADASAKLEKNVPSNSPNAFGELGKPTSNPILQTRLQNYEGFPMEEFLYIGFSHHIIILEKAKKLEERIFYIRKCASEHLSARELKRSLASDDFHNLGSLPNNFRKTISPEGEALKAILSFKDEYLLDFVNVEELGARDSLDVDERMLENGIVHQIRNFILSFGEGFAFIRNQYRIEAFGEEGFIDLLFFNRNLNCLVAVELKRGKFKTSYLGQLQGYLSVLDGFERKPHENPSIGLILCDDVNKPYVDYVIQDYQRPMGVAKYITSKDMPEKLRKALPKVEELRELLKRKED